MTLMTDEPIVIAPPIGLLRGEEAAGAELVSLLERRRSIRRLRRGPFPAQLRELLMEAVRLTPAAYNLPPWHLVLLHERRAAFWELFAEAVDARLDGERRARYLERIAGFRDGVAVAVFYEDTTVAARIAHAWQISERQADAFVQQGLGMAQLSLWLALTAEGLVTSLQHWDWLLEDRLGAFVGAPEEFRLAAVMPIGYADEPPRAVERMPVERVVSEERWTGWSGNGAAGRR
jgi:predicted oxidoreductase (fatty acid repression mutant protein)